MILIIYIGATNYRDLWRAVTKHLMSFSSIGITYTTCCQAFSLEALYGRLEVGYFILPENELNPRKVPECFMCSKWHPCHTCSSNILMNSMVLNAWLFTNKKLKPVFVHRAVNYLGSYQPLCKWHGKQGGSITCTILFVDSFLCIKTVVIFGFGCGLAYHHTDKHCNSIWNLKVIN